MIFIIANRDADFLLVSKNVHKLTYNKLTLYRNQAISQQIDDANVMERRI